MQNPPEGEHQQRLHAPRVLAIAALSSEFPAAPPSAEEMFRASAAAARGRLQEAALLNFAASSTSRTAAVLLNSLRSARLASRRESTNPAATTTSRPRARGAHGDGASPLVQRQPSPRTGFRAGDAGKRVAARGRRRMRRRGAGAMSCVSMP